MNAERANSGMFGAGPAAEGADIRAAGSMSPPPVAWTEGRSGLAAVVLADDDPRCRLVRARERAQGPCGRAEAVEIERVEVELGHVRGGPAARGDVHPAVRLDAAATVAVDDGPVVLGDDPHGRRPA